MTASQLSGVSPLVARDICKSYGARVVLDAVHVVASPGSPLGVVGENGVGKSTLLRVLAGAEAPDSGSVTRPADLAYLAQEPSFPGDATVASVLGDALAPLHAAAHRLEELAGRLEDQQAAAEYADLLEVCVLHEVWDAGRRAEVAAARLGLDGFRASHRVTALSGGERARLALAALVARRPTCLLLDEPTNHLDDEAAAFLEEFLGGLPGVVVVASHDRTFLENVARTVLDLDPSHFGTDGSGGDRYSGSYSGYLHAKRESRARWERAFAEQQDELHLLRQAERGSARHVAHDRPARDNDKFIYHAKGQNVARTVSRRVRDTARRIDAVERARVPKPPAPLVFRAELGGEAAAAARVAMVRDLVVAGRLEVPVLDLYAGRRLLVTGANGSGKSTLLAVLAGHVDATAGQVDVAARTIGYLPQDVTFRKPERIVRALYDGLTGSPVPLQELGLLHPRDHDRPVGRLSLGQQRRLALAVLVARAPDLVLLDEPTNHISLALADELESALRRSTGTVVVASHDRWLRRRWEGGVLRLEGRRHRPSG